MNTPRGDPSPPSAPPLTLQTLRTNPRATVHVRPSCFPCVPSPHMPMPVTLPAWQPRPVHLPYTCRTATSHAVRCQPTPQTPFLQHPLCTGTPQPPHPLPYPNSLSSAAANPPPTGICSTRHTGSTSSPSPSSCTPIACPVPSSPVLFPPRPHQQPAALPRTLLPS